MTASPRRTPRGVRNHNPGNIRHGDRWQGMAAEQADPDFVTFRSAEYGLRALAKVLLSYARRGVDTPAAIAARWAPPVENDTAAYAAHLARALGVGLHDPVDVDSQAVMLPLVEAIIRHENGVQPYSRATLLTGLRLAGVADAEPPPMAKRPSVQAQLVAGCCTALAAVAEVAEPARTAAEQVAPFTAAPWIAHASTALLTVAGAATLAGLGAAWIRKRKGL